MESSEALARTGWTHCSVWPGVCCSDANFTLAPSQRLGVGQTRAPPQAWATLRGQSAPLVLACGDIAEEEAVPPDIGFADSKPEGFSHWVSETRNKAPATLDLAAPEREQPCGVRVEASLAVQLDDRRVAAQQKDNGSDKGSCWGAGCNQDTAGFNGANESLSPLLTATSETSSQQGNEVWIHVYELGRVVRRLNKMVLRPANLGAFHCGLEVLGSEWSFRCFDFAWDDPTMSGVIRNEPRIHPAYLYRESVMLGHTPLSERAIESLLHIIKEEWPANSYHMVSRNCVTFAEMFAQSLQAPEPFPSWVRGAMDACKAPPLKAISNCAWSWLKWWSKRKAEQGALN